MSLEDPDIVGLYCMIGDRAVNTMSCKTIIIINIMRVMRDSIHFIEKYFYNFDSKYHSLLAKKYPVRMLLDE